MADSLPQPAVRPPSEALVHPGVVRVTHWLIVAGFLCLLVSGTAILISHPRFYWGETGTIDMPSLFDLPLEPIFGHSGWGRYLHFQAAWLLVLSGFVYVVAGLTRGHFSARLLPDRSQLGLRAIRAEISSHLRWRRPPADAAWRYNVVQQLAYLLVIFVLLPSMIWTGLAMSPTMTAQYPFLVTVLGGHQSARTLHFGVATALVAFAVVHVAMLFLVGFGAHLRAMVTGYRPSGGHRR